MIPVLRSIAHIRQHWRLAILAFTSLALATVFSLLVPQILRTVIDQGLPLPWPQAMFSGRLLVDGLQVAVARPSLVFQAAVLLLGLSVLRAAVAFGQRFFESSSNHYIAYEIRNDFYKKVPPLPFSYPDQSQRGQIITRAITDIDAVRTFIAQGLMDGVNVGFLIIGVDQALRDKRPHRVN